MQNSPGTQTPAKKPGLSKGCIIGIVAAALLAVGGIVIVLAAAGGLYWLNRQAQTATGGGPARGASTSSPTTGVSDDEAETPSPTSEQTAAVSGGQSARWEQQEMSWTVPQKWSRQSADSRSFIWRSPGSSDAATLIVSVSPMSADFPAETSLNAFYQAAQTRRQNGEVDEVRWLKLGGVKGVQFRESAPEDADGAQRLQWMAYRNYKGQTQLVNVMLATRGRDFARHEDTLYGVLYTTDLSQ